MTGCEACREGGEAAAGGHDGVLRGKLDSQEDFQGEQRFQWLWSCNSTSNILQQIAESSKFVKPKPVKFRAKPCRVKPSTSSPPSSMLSIHKHQLTPVIPQGMRAPAEGIGTG